MSLTQRGKIYGYDAAVSRVAIGQRLGESDYCDGEEAVQGGVVHADDRKRIRSTPDG